MDRDPHAPAAGPVDGPADSSARAGYAGVARRISRLTANILATAVVLILLLLVGQNLGDLWRSSTTKSPSPMGAPQVSRAALHDGAATVQFGHGQLALIQSQIAGNSAAAVKELRRICRTAASKSAREADRPLGEAEKRLLGLLTAEGLVERLDAHMELFLLPGVAPLAVVTKNGVLAADVRGLDAGKVAVSGRRVVVWGIALPRGKDEWTVYAFRAQAASGDARGSLPLPPEAVSILNVERQGESIMAFRGTQANRIGDWRAFYDHWAAEHEMSQTAPWSENNGAWSIRFEGRGSQPRECVSIQFGPDARGGLRGLITTSRDAAQGG